ncbi:MAG: hypothetical protein FJ020_00350 [Chloroflexi bacterium]|nr:hypothetical protein [Chloroflexota bacterium]
MWRLGLLDKPKLLLEGTIRVVQAIVAYAIVDGQPSDFSLRMQRYNPSLAPDARYAFTLDLCGKAFARILVDAGLRTLDLADLHNHPLDDFQVAGYHRIWVSHPDWSPITAGELQQLEEAVTNDLRSGYSEDELAVSFQPLPDLSCLLVSLHDLPKSEVT